MKNLFLRRAAETAAGAQGPAARPHFVWSLELQQALVDFVHLRCQVRERPQAPTGLTQCAGGVT